MNLIYFSFPEQIRNGLCNFCVSEGKSPQIGKYGAGSRKTAKSGDPEGDTISGTEIPAYLSSLDEDTELMVALPCN